MTVFQTIRPKILPGVTVGHTPDTLAEIRNEDCAAAIWQRAPEPEFQSWIDALPAETLPRARIVLRSSAVREAVTEVCTVNQTPHGGARGQLIEDVVALADCFGEIMKTQYLRLRLDVITSNACRKFHIDAVTARLICTYRGTGTQLGIGTRDQQPVDILTVTAGSPVVLRGTRWPERPAAKLLHRSPPIEGTGETRLLFVLDPVDDLQDAAGETVFQ